MIQRLFKGFLATIAVLLGLVIGCAVAFALGDMNFGKVAAKPSVGLTPPFLFGMPKFDVGRDHHDDHRPADHRGGVDRRRLSPPARSSGKRIKAADIGNVLRADGLATTIGGIFNSFPYTASPRTSAWCGSPASRAAGWWPPRA